MENFAGFGVRGYKSFGSETIALFGPMDNIHLIIGKNNVGKSNALRFMSDIVARFRPNLNGEGRLSDVSLFDQTPEDYDEALSRIIRVGIRLNDEVLSPFGKYLHNDGFREHQSDIVSLLQTEAYNCGNANVAWLDFEVTRHPTQPNTVGVIPSPSQFELGRSQLTNDGIDDWLRNTANELRNQTSSPIDNFRELLGVLDLNRIIPQVERVEAIREITSDTEDSNRLPFANGRGIIIKLAALDRPSKNADYKANKERFQAFKKFVRVVLDDQNADIEIPDAKDDLLVRTGSHGKVESIQKLGSGIAEVIILAAASTVVSGALICIEEPELHLHPTLQRKLIQYLSTDTANRYLLSTHSAAILDSTIASISHITMDDDGWTHAEPVISRATLSRAVADLGNRASDIVQSNYVVWVEGAADRIYIAHWINKVNPNLIEGVHYSIMFYGGSMLKHLSAEDDEVTEFIQLASINRNFAIVIDSDRENEDEALNDVKERVLKALCRHGSLGWVTAGYTIENYVPTAVLKAVIARQYPKSTYLMPEGQFASPLGKKFEGTKNSYPGKVAVARRVVEKDIPIEEWPYDLKEQMEELVKRIWDANG